MLPLLTRTAATLFLAVFAVTMPFQAFARSGGAGSEKVVPPALLKGLEYLIGIARTEGDARGGFDPSRADTVLQFVLSPKDGEAIYHTDGRFNTPSAYFEFEIESGLTHLLETAFNPLIPAYSFTPSSVRYSSLIEGQMAVLAPKEAFMSSEEGPVLLRGVEFVENSPDTFSGAYYNYHLDRAIVVYKSGGKNILISLSKQKDVSSVGKKGYVLPPDGAWNYLYAEQTGVTLPGLGWVKSYMYDSWSVAFYVEDPGAERVKCGIFKGVRAGWKGMNMVKREHIHAGLLRFAGTFKSIVEHSALRNLDRLSKGIEEIAALSEAELRKRSARLLEKLRDGWERQGDRKGRKALKVLSGSSYLNGLAAEEMRGMLIVEYVKTLLGSSLTDHGLK